MATSLEFRRVLFRSNLWFPPGCAEFFRTRSTACASFGHPASPKKNNSPTSAPCSPMTSPPRISASPSLLYPLAAAKALSPSPLKCATGTSPPRAGFYLPLPIHFLPGRALHPAKSLRSEERRVGKEDR